MRPLFAALLLSACNPGSEVVLHDASGFDVSCDGPTDCSLVFTGNVCGCSCDLVAISSGDFDDYQQSWFDAQAECAEVLSCPAACAEPTVTCDAQTCGTF